MSLQVQLGVKARIDTIDQFHVLTEFISQFLFHQVIQLFAVDIGQFHRFADKLLVGCKQLEVLFIDIVHSFECGSHTDRPAERSHMYAQFRFKFIHQVKGVATFAVHLIHKHNDGRITHTTHVHQFTGLRFHSFGSVHHNDHTIHRCECTESIFGKVLVTGCIENIDFVITVFETHHRGSHRNSTLLFDFHPVGSGCFSYLI